MAVINGRVITARPAPARGGVGVIRPAPAPRTGGGIVIRPAPARPPANSPPTIQPHRVPAWNPPTTSLDIVREIADVMQVPPAQITSDYVNRCIHAASYVKNPVNQSYLPVTTSSTTTYRRLPQVTRSVVDVVLTTFRNVFPTLSVTQPRQPSKKENDRVLGQQARSHVLAHIEQVADFCRLAGGAGFAPPSNPYTEIGRLNATRRPGKYSPLPLAQQEADDLLYNIQAFVDLVEAWQKGYINLTTGTIDKAQLAHVRLSYDGFGGSGNPAADIEKFLPSLDEIKKQRADQALAVIDFKKRTPYVLFTLDYTPEQSKPSRGTIIAWKKIPDASGYVLKRRDIFAQADYELNLTNAQVKDATSSALMAYAKQYALSMLDNIDENSVLMWLDPSVPENDAFVYRIQAYQIRAEMKGSVFTVDSNPASVTAATKLNIQNQLASLGEQNQDLVSPWPTFAQQLIGDSQYDWLLAAVNVRASINRGDPKETTRKYSYLNAQRTFLFEQADKNRLVIPTRAGIQAVIDNIKNGIEKYGVTQVIQDLIDETGITYFFDGRDPNGITSFTRAGQQSTATSPLFNVIGSCIDPDTATLDLKSLASNLPQILGAGVNSYSTSLSSATPTVGNDPQEIAIQDPNEATASSAEGPAQFLNQIGDLKDSVIDLTTFEGLAKLLRTIRILSDFGPDRIKPKPTIVRAL